MTKQENKNSAKKKLIPAVAMLTTSAVMLSTSTYAWFTMSREVEVTGLNMTATVPEDIQISLGTIGTAPNAAETNANGKSLANSSGVLVCADGKTSASDGNVKAPTNIWDWSNTADISAYYNFGKMIPASSTTGENIYFTPDASGVGKTVDGQAVYYEAALSNVAKEDASTDNTTDNNNYRTSLYAYTSEKSSGDKTTKTFTDYKQSSAWNVTNDDGYYIDIPVWIRSSATTDINLKVDGYVLPKTGTKLVSTADVELYKAVRVAILNGDDVVQGISGTAVGKPVQANNIINLLDAWNKSEGISGTDSNKYDSIVGVANPYNSNLNGIIDSNLYNTRNNIAGNVFYAVKGLGTQKQNNAGVNYYPGEYDTYNAYNSNASDANSVATLTPPSEGQEYGTAKKIIIRVWLDGEDEQCWNQNAGQDWAISLKFSKIDNSTT